MEATGQPETRDAGSHALVAGPLPSDAPPPRVPLIECEEAAIASRDDPATLLVDGVNWTIGTGDFWVVAGPPACGKSQLLETAAGLLRPAKGQHRLFGRLTSALAPDELAAARRRVGFVFGGGGRLFNHLTVAQNVALPLCYHRECEPDAVAEPVQALLARTGLAGVAGRLPGRLNPGCRQRVALVRALALEPDVLLLDGPLSGSDARESGWWLEFLPQLVQGHPALGGKRVAIALTTDDPRRWRVLGRQFALISEGRWRPLGGRAELAGSPDLWLRELLAESSLPY